MDTGQLRRLPIRGQAQWLRDGRIAVISPRGPNEIEVDGTVSVGSLDDAFPTSDVVAKSSIFWISPDRRQAAVQGTKQWRPSLVWSWNILDTDRWQILKSLPDGVFGVQWLDNARLIYGYSGDGYWEIFHLPSNTSVPFPSSVVSKVKYAASPDGERLAAVVENPMESPQFGDIDVSVSHSVVLYQRSTLKPQLIFDTRLLPEGPPVSIP
jgi:hypothetical protein